jgi:hypothetical protein
MASICMLFEVRFQNPAPIRLRAYNCDHENDCDHNSVVCVKRSQVAMSKISPAQKDKLRWVAARAISVAPCALLRIRSSCYQNERQSICGGDERIAKTHDRGSVHHRMETDF